MATNHVSGRQTRRHQHLHRASGRAQVAMDPGPMVAMDPGPMAAMSAGPMLRPVAPAPLPARPSRERGPRTRTVASLLRSVVLAVNARGLCAAHAARLAELPVAEVVDIEQMCQCQGCLRQQAQ